MFHQFWILLSPFYFILFLLYDLFHHIPCHQTYLSDCFHRILFQYLLYFSGKSSFPVSKFNIISQSIFIISAYLISFIKFLVIIHINLISFIRLFVNIIYVYPGTQFYQFREVYIIIQYLFIIFTNLISFIRFLVIKYIYPISFIGLFFNIIYISFGNQCSQLQKFYIIS